MPPSAAKRRPRPRVSRGTLSRRDIARAALALMRDDPQRNLTMERVAKALGTRPMSLYTHVRSRDDLIDCAADLALREWTVPLPRRGDWERQVRSWCGSLRAHIRRHPALVWELTRGGGFRPALLEKVALLARSLRSAGLEGRALADVLRWIPQTVIGAIVLELARPANLQSIRDEGSAIYASLGALDARDRAELADLLPFFSDRSLDDLFEYTIDRLIDGIRSRLG
jgi:AcrR family transcriptional regulator